MQSIVDAFFTIYLEHYPICIAIGYMMTRADVPVWLGYSSDIILTFGLSLLIHRAVSRSAVALFLLNGVKPTWFAPARQHG